jgi:hypothetical protein
VTAFFGALSLVLAIATPQANATGAQSTVAMYLDQPFVQGSFVSESYAADTSVTTFNDQSYGDTCSFNGATVEPLYSGSPDCHVQTLIQYGGASTTSSTPVVGQEPDPVNYGQVGSGGASIVFDTPQTYFGMWWSAGSVGNQIQLLNGSEVVASTSANDVADTINYTGSITAQNGDAYSTSFYIANPVDWYEVGTPTSYSNQDSENTYQSHQTLPAEPFVYIHFIAESGVTFDRVNLIAPGNGFEFDNFTTSIATGISNADVGYRLVLQKQLYAATYVDFDANGGTGALPRQYSVDNMATYLQATCLDYEDSTRCIRAPNDSYATSFMRWNTEPDGSGDSYDYMGVFPFAESKTLYAQWQTDFYYYNMTNPDANASNIWDYAVDDGYSYTTNFSDLTLPSPSRTGQSLEGWYTFNSDWSSLIRVGDPGAVLSASDYTAWGYGYLFARWIDDTPPPPPTVDAVTPQVLLVYPRATSVGLPSMPLTGDTSAAICIVESDSSGNEVSGNLQFTDLGTSTSGYSSGYTISAASPLVANAYRYVRVTVSTSSDTSCTSGYTHVVEIKPLGARLTAVLPLNLTAR